MLKIILIWLNFVNRANSIVMTVIHSSSLRVILRVFVLFCFVLFVCFSFLILFMYHTGQYCDKIEDNKKQKHSAFSPGKTGIKHTDNFCYTNVWPKVLSDTIKKNSLWLNVPLPTAQLSSLEISTGISKSQSKEKMPGSKKWAWVFLWVMRFSSPCGIPA